jgi:hypothetical protein
MFLAIMSKYHGPTDTRGSKVRAKVDGYTVTVGYASELDSEANHRAAVVALCAKLNWDADRFFGGSLDDGRWAWVPVSTYDWEQRQKEVRDATGTV